MNFLEVILMKPDYKNWLPETVLHTGIKRTAIPLILGLVFGVFGLGILPTPIRLVLIFVFSMATFWFGYKTYCWYGAYQDFDLNNPRSIAWKVISGVAGKVDLPPRAKVLDIGTGSGALALAIARRHPDAMIIGTDPWDQKVTPGIDQKLCQSNARAEGVKHTVFMYGIAQKIEFPDETFDAVVSNYVYHHVQGMDRVDAILEALRTVKKGGVFVIHDIMTRGFYGDKNILLKRVLESGVREAELIPTDDGAFLTPAEAEKSMLKGSCLLIGRK